MAKITTDSREALAKGRDLLHDLAAQSKLVLFVAPDDKVGAHVKAEALRAGMPHFTGKWIAGTLTNHATLRKRIERLEEIEWWERDGNFKLRPKTEQARLQREKHKILIDYDGLRGLVERPAAIVIASPGKPSLAIGEARKIGAKIIEVRAKEAPASSADISIQVYESAMATVVGRLADALIEGKPPEQPRAGPSKGPQRGGGGPGMAPVPAKLRPKPSPKSGRARTDG